MAQEFLSPLEHMLLTAVVLLGNDAYGMAIFEKAQELGKPYKVKVPYGSIYATLDRMERAGWLKSWLSAPIAERGGRRRRHYQLQGLGQKLLRDSNAFHNDLGGKLKVAWGMA